jgi:putative methionine-R-sulfoxide reductase with GAF domain
MLFSVFKLNSVKSKVIEKIVYKEIEKQAENQVDTIEEKSEEEVIEKAMELSNKVLFELGDMDDIEKYCDKLLINISKNFNIVQGVFFVLDKSDNKFKTKGTYAFYSEEVFREFELGVGLTGQVAKNKRFLTINNVPEQYIKILSGLGSGSPGFLTLIPVINDDNTIGIIEIASFEKLSDDLEKLSMHLSLEIGSDIIRFF